MNIIKRLLYLIPFIFCLISCCLLLFTFGERGYLFVKLENFADYILDKCQIGAF